MSASLHARGCNDSICRSSPKAHTTRHMQTCKRASGRVFGAAVSPPSTLAEQSERRMGCVQGISAVLSACRRIHATASVAWAAGICVGGISLYCSLPPIINTHAWHSREASVHAAFIRADSRRGHSTSVSQSGRRSRIEPSILVRTYVDSRIYPHDHPCRPTALACGFATPHE